MRLVVLCLLVTAVTASSHGSGDHHGKGDGKGDGKGGMMGGKGDGNGGMMGGKSMDHGPQCVCNITTPADTKPFKMSLKNATCVEAGAKCKTMCKTLMEKLKNGTMFKPLPMGPKGMDRWGRPRMDYRKICCMNAPSQSVSATVKYMIKSSSCQKDFTDVPGSVMFNCKNVTCGDMKGKGGMDDKGKGKDMDRMGGPKGKDPMGPMDPLCVCNITTPAGPHGKPHPIPGATCVNIEAKCEEKCKDFLDKLKERAQKTPRRMVKDGMKGKHRPMDRYGKSQKGKDGKGKGDEEKMKKMEMMQHYTKICCINNSTTTVQATVRHWVNSTEVGCSTSPQNVAGNANFDCSQVKCDHSKGKGDKDGKGKGKGDMDGKAKGKGDMDRMDGKGKMQRNSRGPMCICDMVTPAGVQPNPHMIYGATCDNIREKCKEVCGKLLGKLQDLSKMKIDEMMRGIDKYEDQWREMKMHRLKGKYLHTKLCCMNQASTSVSASVTSWVDGDGCSEDATALPGSTSINCTMVNCSRIDSMKERLEQMKKGKWPKGPKEGYGRQGKGMDTQGKGKKEDMDPLCICNMTTSMGTKAIPHPIPALTCDDDVRAKCSEVCMGLLQKLQGMKTLLPISSHGGGDHHEEEQDKGKGKGMDKEMSDKEHHKKICCDHKSTTSVSAAINFWVKSETCGIDTAANLGSANIDCMGMKCDARPKGPREGYGRQGEGMDSDGKGKEEDIDPLCVCNMTTSMGTKAMLHPIPELTCNNDVRAKCSEVCMGLLEKLRGMKTLLPISSHGGGDHHEEEQDKGKGKGMDKEMSDKEHHKKICCDHKSTTSVSATINFWVKSKTCGNDTATNLGTANIDCMGMKCDARPKVPEEEDKDPLCVCNMTTSMGTKAMLHPIPELTCNNDVRAKCSEVCMGLLDRLRGMKTMLPISSHGGGDHHGKEQEKGKGKGMDKEMSDKEQHKKICCDHKSTTSVSAVINFWVKSKTCGIDTATNLGTANIDCMGMKCDARPKGLEEEDMDPLCVCNMTTSMGTKAMPHPIRELTCDNDPRAKCSEVCTGLLEKLRGMKTMLLISSHGGGDHHGKEQDKGKGKGMDKEMSNKEQHKKICCDHKSTTSVSAAINFWVKSKTCGIDTATNLGTADIDCMGMTCDARPKVPNEEDMDPICVCNITTSMGTKAMPYPTPELSCDNDVGAKCSEVCNGLLGKLRGMTTMVHISSHGGGDHHGKEQDNGKGKGMGKEMSDKEHHKKICCDHKSTTSVLAAISFWVKSNTCGINTATNLGSANIECMGMKCDAPGKGAPKGRSGGPGQARPEGGNVAENARCTCRLRAPVASPLPEIPLSCPDCRCPDNERKCMKRCKDMFEASLPKYFCCGQRRIPLVTVQASTETSTSTCPAVPLAETWTLSCSDVQC